MALPNLKNGFKARAAAVGLGALVAITPLVGTFAQEANSTPQIASVTSPATTQPASYETASPTYTLAVEALSAAQKYAKENDAIGVIVSFGDFEGAASPEYVGGKFVAALEKRGEEASLYILTGGDVPGYSISFALGEIGRGPMGVSEAVSSIDDIVTSKRNLREMLTSNVTTSPSFAALNN